jgi:putative peptide modification system cyclase
MERDPAATAIDRTTGSEVAQREGARALILPTIAEIGGRVRFTAEVVDPRTQATVYSDSADGIGANSVLPSVDAVNRDLRGQLGEALANITGDSQPLEKVATADLDALRAYSKAVEAQQQNRMAEALELYRQSLRVDPDFATARVQIGVILRNTGNRSGALAELNAAKSHQDRLSARDRLNVEALIASVSASPREALEKWRMLAALYPDFFPAQNTLGFYAWQGANRSDEAIEALTRSVAPQNPGRGLGHYVLGAVLMGADRLDESLAHFRESEAAGRRFENQFFAAAHAVQRDFDSADKTMARGVASGVAGTDVSTLLTRAIFKIDQGLWTDGRRLIDQALASGHQVGPRHVRMIDSVNLTWSALTEPADQHRRRIADFLAVERENTLAAGDPGALADRQRRLLLAAWLAARVDAADTARAALAQVRPEFTGVDYPELAQRRVLAEAELARSEGRAADAVAQLTPVLDGNEFYSLRVGMMTALAAQGDLAVALENARWLRDHRGRAYSEMHGDHMMMLFNVAQSNVAILAAAELSFAAGDHESARRDLAAFLERWPKATLPEPFATRVGSLQVGLASTSSAAVSRS